MENKVSKKEIALVIIAALCFVGAVVSVFLLKPIITIELMVIMAVFLLLYSMAGRKEVKRDTEEDETKRKLSEALENALKDVSELRKENEGLKRTQTKKDNGAFQAERERDSLSREVTRLKKELEEVKGTIDAKVKDKLNKLLEEGKSKSKPESMRTVLFDEKLLKEEERLDLRKVIAETVEEMKPFAQAAGVRIAFAEGPSEIGIKGSRRLFSTMLKNILDNSIKYMLRPGSMVVTLSDVGEDIFIICKDDGMGIDAEELDHIFELNYQGSNRVSGNGLGLTQAKDIVTAYGGVIYARSAPGSGMGVYIQLPKAEN